MVTETAEPGLTAVPAGGSWLITPRWSQNLSVTVVDGAEHQPGGLQDLARPGLGVAGQVGHDGRRHRQWTAKLALLPRPPGWRWSGR